MVKAIDHLPNSKAQGKTKNIGKSERYLQTKLTKGSNLLVKQFLKILSVWFFGSFFGIFGSLLCVLVCLFVLFFQRKGL